MLGADLEKILRTLIREELARLIGVELDQLAEDETDLRARVAERAARLRAGRVAR